jgi:ribonuclease HI
LLKQLGKDKRAGYAVITPNRTYRKRVHQQSTVFSTEQEAIIKAVWLTEGTQRDKVIITDSLSRLTAINGNNHTKNPKTIKQREMMDRNKKQINFCEYQETKKQMRKQRQRWMMTYNKMKNTPQTISKNG